MLNSKSLKIAFATLFASLTLLLSLFATTGIASAHSTSQSAEHNKDRKCVLIIREHVTFVPFRNLRGNRDWDSWGWRFANQDRDFTINANGFDNNQWHFNNFDRRDRNHFAGFFIVKVTEILKCNGKVQKVQTFTFIER
jgi:hypothetical protein